MPSSLLKKITTFIVLLSFVTIILFGFSTMMYGADENMFGDCPFSAMRAPLCPQNITAIILHHISSYRSFVSVPIDFGVMVVFISILLAIAIIMVSARRSLLGLLAPVGAIYDSPPDNPYRRAVTRWFSLHENSPIIF